jgi:hypothetical protein
MKKLLISASLLWAVALTTVAQDNFKLIGKIDGADSDTLCIEYVILQPEKQIVKRKVAVENGDFTFSAELPEAYAGSMFLKSNPKETLYTYFVPNEEAVFSGRLNSVEEHWGGSAFYQQYEQVIDVQRPFNKEFAAARNEPDSIRGLKNRDINSRAKPLYLKYIEEHPNEDATVALLIHVNYDQVLTAIGKLTPEVRNGRMKSEIASYEKMFTLVMKEHAAREAVKNDTVTIGGQVPELGLKDLDGKPAILHPLTVGMAGNNRQEIIGGFLHDVVEDSDLTVDDLLRKGVDEDIVDALRLLTHEKGSDYSTYIQRIIDSGNRLAQTIKLNDLKHNLRRGRAGGHMKQVTKHEKALAMFVAAGLYKDNE